MQTKYEITQHPDGIKHKNDTPFAVIRRNAQGDHEVVAYFHSRVLAVQYATGMTEDASPQTLAQ